MILTIRSMSVITTVFIPAVKYVSVTCVDNHLVITFSLMNNNEKIEDEFKNIKGVIGTNTDYRQHIHDLFVHIDSSYWIDYELPRS